MKKIVKLRKQQKDEKTPQNSQMKNFRVTKLSILGDLIRVNWSNFVHYFHFLIEINFISNHSSTTIYRAQGGQIRTELRVIQILSS